MSDGVRQKDPDAELNFGFDWADHLIALGGGLTIAASTWVYPAGVTEIVSSFTGSTTTTRVGGGTDGSDYELTNNVTLSDGQKVPKVLTIEVRQGEAGSPRDSADRANMLTVLRVKAQETASPTLESFEVEGELDNARYASTWLPNKAYSVGDRVVPEIRNGHYYICVQPGTSQSGAKSYTDWPSNYGQCFGDGSSDPQLIWEEAGSDLFNPGIAGCERNVYDLGRAARECWLLKSRKSTQAIDDGDVSFSQWHEHCLKQAAMFYPVRRRVEVVRG